MCPTNVGEFGRYISVKDFSFFKKLSFTRIDDR